MSVPDIPPSQLLARIAPPETGVSLFAAAGATGPEATLPGIRYIAQRGSAESRRVCASVANQIARRFGYPSYREAPWSALDPAMVHELRRLLSERGVAPATANLYLSTLRGIARQAFIHKQISFESYERIRLVPAIKAHRLPRGRALPIAEVTALMDTCLTTEGVLGIRDAAVLAALFGCGLRRAEAAALTMASFVWQENALRVHGKGNKERLAPMPQRVMEILQLWLDERTGDPGPLFIRYRGRIPKGYSDHQPTLGDEGQFQGLSTNALYNIVRQRAVQAGIDHASPHDLRRSFATYLLDQEINIHIVSHMMGHARIDTTRLYDKGVDKSAKKAAEKLSF